MSHQLCNFIVKKNRRLALQSGPHKETRRVRRGELDSIMWSGDTSFADELDREQDETASTGSRPRERPTRATLGCAATQPPAAELSAELPPVDRKAAKTMKPKQLKAALRARRLSAQGNKKELLARLLLYEPEASRAADVADQ